PRSLKVERSTPLWPCWPKQPMMTQVGHSKEHSAESGSCGDDIHGHGGVLGARAPGGRVGRGRRAWSSSRHIGGLLRTLQREDPRCVLVVRGVGGLGDWPEYLLSMHFLEFGDVGRVLVARLPRAAQGRGREAAVAEGRGQQTAARPKGQCVDVGFVVMGDPRSVELALRHGSKQTLLASDISIAPFGSTALKTPGCSSTSAGSTSAGRPSGSSRSASFSSGCEAEGLGPSSAGSTETAARAVPRGRAGPAAQAPAVSAPWAPAVRSRSAPPGPARSGAAA
ncbi:unnamed protein product, partial [Prorocentrum cordatum]